MRWVGCPPALSAWESVTTHHSDATKKTILWSDEQRWTSARWKMPAVEVELITQNYTVCIFRGSPFPSTAQAWKEWAQRGVTWASLRSGALGPCQGLVAGLRARLIRGCQDGGMSGLRNWSWISRILHLRPGPCGVASNYALLLSVVNLIFPQNKKGYSEDTLYWLLRHSFQISFHIPL